MEIERKFLVKELPSDIEQYPHIGIEQGYLCTSPTLRIRKAGDCYWLTVKENKQTKSGAIHNREEEFQLSSEKYNILKAKCDGRMVCKTRYMIPLAKNNLIAELDIFHGYHEGIVLVEVEFPSTIDADTFTPPSWFGNDVSKLPQYRNSNMAFQ